MSVQAPVPITTDIHSILPSFESHSLLSEKKIKSRFFAHFSIFGSSIYFDLFCDPIVCTHSTLSIVYRCSIPPFQCSTQHSCLLLGQRPKGFKSKTKTTEACSPVLYIPDYQYRYGVRYAFVCISSRLLEVSQLWNFQFVLTFNKSNGKCQKL